MIAWKTPCWPSDLDELDVIAILTYWFCFIIIDNVINCFCGPSCHFCFDIFPELSEMAYENLEGYSLCL